MIASLEGHRATDDFWVVSLVVTYRGCLSARLSSSTRSTCARSASSREHEGKDLTCARFLECRAASLERCAGRADVVDEQHTRSFHHRPFPRPESTANILESLSAVEGSLSRRVSRPNESPRGDPHVERARDGLSEERSLIVAAVGEAPWMQRNGDDEIDRPHDLPGGTEHRPPEAWPEISAALVFEASDRSCHRASVLERRDEPTTSAPWIDLFDGRCARRAEQDVRRNVDVARCASRWPDELADGVREDGSKRGEDGHVRMCRPPPRLVASSRSTSRTGSSSRSTGLAERER